MSQIAATVALSPSPIYQSIPAVFDLSTLDGSNGFIVVSDRYGETLGFSVSSAGDINGDGIDDLIFGAPYGNTLEENPDYPHATGTAYVVFGRADGFPATLTSSDLDGSNGFDLYGRFDESFFGSSVGSVGDVNGDGIDDLIVGGWKADPNGTWSGESYVVFGSTEGFAADIGGADLDGSNGFRIAGAGVFDYSGRSVTAIGDVNGDGFVDIAIGAAGVGVSGDTGEGAVYVLYGHAGGFAADIDLGSIGASDGFVVRGYSGEDFIGNAVAPAGDFNGDGIDDFLIGGPTSTTDAGTAGGQTYLIFGTTEGFPATIDVATLDGTDGFTLNGYDQRLLSNIWSGYSVASAGDVNADGYDDILIGAYRADTDDDSAREIGSTFVVFGHGGATPANIDLAALDGTDGFRLDGINAGDYSGVSVSSAGDFDGDGFDDLLVGAFGGSGTPGEAFVIFGAAGGFAPVTSLAALDGTNGFRIPGLIVDGLLGNAVSAAGDVNGDGLDDIVVAAPATNEANDASGRSYVIFGIAPDAAVTRTGTVIGQTLSGGDFDDTLDGRAGDDTLYGRGGADTLVGGGGDDVLNGGTGDDSLDGGYGRDTASYALATSGVTVSLNGAASQNTGSDGTDTLVSIENLTGSGYADTLEGTYGINVLTGLAGADTLLGRSGADTLVGGRNGDTLNGGNGADWLAGDEGDDICFGGQGDDTIFGGVAADTLYGNDGADVIDGGAGTDTLIGGLGGDDLDGGDGNDTLTGSAGADVLRGNFGNDMLDGGGGADRLIGGAGNDILTGSFGKDVIAGSAGADGFLFGSTFESGRFASGADWITDFSQAENDTIRLGNIDADISTAANDRFTFVGTETFSGTAGELRYYFDGSGDTVILMDVDGDYVSDMAIRLTGEIALEASDFVGVDAAAAAMEGASAKAATAALPATLFEPVVDLAPAGFDLLL